MRRSCAEFGQRSLDVELRDSSEERLIPPDGWGLLPAPGGALEARALKQLLNAPAIHGHSPYARHLTRETACLPRL